MANEQVEKKEQTYFLNITVIEMPDGEFKTKVDIHGSLFALSYALQAIMQYNKRIKQVIVNAVSKMLLEGDIEMKVEKHDSVPIENFENKNKEHGRS